MCLRRSLWEKELGCVAKLLRVTFVRPICAQRWSKVAATSWQESEEDDEEDEEEASRPLDECKALE